MSTPTRMGKNALVRGSQRHQGSLQTPTGTWQMPTWAFGKASTPPPGSKLDWKQITSSIYWSSEAATYNQWVDHPSAGEHLIKYADQSYKYAINTGYNAYPNPTVQGAGPRSSSTACTWATPPAASPSERARWSSCSRIWIRRSSRSASSGPPARVPRRRSPTSPSQATGRGVSIRRGHSPTGSERSGLDVPRRAASRVQLGRPEVLNANHATVLNGHEVVEARGGVLVSRDLLVPPESWRLRIHPH